MRRENREQSRATDIVRETTPVYAVEIPLQPQVPMFDAQHFFCRFRCTADTHRWVPARALLETLLQHNISQVQRHLANVYAALAGTVLACALGAALDLWLHIGGFLTLFGGESSVLDQGGFRSCCVKGMGIPYLTVVFTWRPRARPVDRDSKESRLDPEVDVTDSIICARFFSLR